MPEPGSPAGDPPDPSPGIKLNASPSKRVLLNQARAFSPDIAIFEIVDNAIDEWRGTSRPPAGSSEPLEERGATHTLEIGIHFEFAGDKAASIRITDNGGGVPTERLQALVQAGSVNPNENAIGVWGQGLKVACTVLANDTVFRTRYRGGTTYRIAWMQPWWNTDDWSLYAEEDPDQLPEGTFEVTLTNLKSPLRRGEVRGEDDDELQPERMGESLLSRLQRTYAPILSRSKTPQVRLTLYDNGAAYPVEPDPFGDPDRHEELFAFPPGFEPTTHTHTFDTKRGLTAKAVVGLLPEQSRDLSGVTMYGKGRLFALAMKEGTVGFGTRGAAMIPASHPTTWRLLVLLYFDGPSDLIPWRAPTKDGYAPNNPFAKDIRTFIGEIAAPYASFTRVAKRLDILPFSKEWLDYDQDERTKAVQQYAKSPEAAAEVLRENPHLLKPTFKPTITAAGRLRNAKSQLPPALNLTASRTVANSLAKRETGDPKLWSQGSYPKFLAEAEAKRKEEQQALAAATSRIMEEWRSTRTYTVRASLEVALRVDAAAASTTANEWILEAIRQRLGREVEPLFAIPSKTGEKFRPVLRLIVEKMLGAFPTIEAIALFGSVARGEADRISDIDLLVLHEDRLLVQRSLNEMFRDFRYPAHDGERYEVRPQVTTKKGLEALHEDADEKVQAMLKEAIWLRGGPA